MDAILLSAGYAERLRPLTDHLPKCLLPVGKRGTMLKYWLETLDKLNIRDIYNVICWKKENIKEYTKSLSLKNSFVYSVSEEVLVPVGMILHILEDLLGDRFLIINSDTFISEERVEEFIRSDKKIYPMHIGVSYQEKTEDKSLLEINGDGIMQSFIEKPKNGGPGYSYAGILIASKEVSSGIVETDKWPEITPDIVSKYVGNASVHDIGEIIDIGGSLIEYYKAVRRIG